MATIYSKTDNFNLNLYGDNDPADLRDGYNDSMRTIDGQLETHLNRIEKAESEAQHDTEVMKALIGDNTVDAAANSKKTWDNGTTIASHNLDVLDAFNLTTVESAKSLRKEIDRDLDGYALFVGDSITEGLGLTNDQKRYWQFVAEGLGCTGKAYAKSGAGWYATPQSDPNTTLNTLAQDMVNDNSINAERVKYVFLMGGINDDNDHALDAQSNCHGTLNRVFNKYPKAEIFLGVCPTAGASRQNNKQIYSGLPAAMPNVTALQKLSSAFPTLHILPCWDMLWRFRDMTTDGLHPNALGHQFFASQILSAMNGDYEKMGDAIFLTNLFDHSTDWPEGYEKPSGDDVAIQYSKYAYIGVYPAGTGQYFLRAYNPDTDKIAVKLSENKKTYDSIVVPIAEMRSFLCSYRKDLLRKNYIQLSESSYLKTVEKGSVRIDVKVRLNISKNMIEAEIFTINNTGVPQNISTTFWNNGSSNCLSLAYR